MASRHQGKHKARHHTQANRGSRVVTLPPLPVAAETTPTITAETPAPVTTSVIEQDQAAEAQPVA
jgi:hypothetical protein